MKFNKQIKNPQHSRQSKFLTRTQSYASLPFFCCSTPFIEHQATENIPIKSISSKMSMKNLINKSAVLPTKGPISSAQSQHNFVSKKSDNGSVFNGHSRYQSQLSNHSQSPRNVKSKVSMRVENNIKFSFKKHKKEGENSIQNFQTTNYIVGKCIVQPQKMNIIVHNLNQVQQQQNHISNHLTNTGRYFDLSGQFEEQQNKGNRNLKNPQQACQPQPDLVKMPPTKPAEPHPNIGHFSFGKRQKHQLMSKYLTPGLKEMREVESIRQSQHSKQSMMVRESFQPDIFKQEGPIKGQDCNQMFLKSSFRKNAPIHLEINEAGAIISDQSQSDSNDQGGIEDYQTIAKKKLKLSFKKQDWV